MGDKYVLAMYDVRGKQKFIFRSNRIKDIVGGSCIIRDCFKDYLYPAAVEYRNQEFQMGSEDAIYRYNADTCEKFSFSSFEERMRGNQYVGEVLYDGGGNFLVLYRSAKDCVEINKIFTRSILQKVGTLQVLCSYEEINDPSDYRNDNKKLREIHARNEAEETITPVYSILPFVQVDRMSSFPIVKKDTRGKEDYSLERWAKYEKYNMVKDAESERYGEMVLDRLVREKGEDSMLAVIFIDGNRMGAKVETCLKGVDPSYESSINKLREFSSQIQKYYVDERRNAIHDALQNKHKNDKEQKQYERMIVFAGDEMSFICRAEDALCAVRAYFKDLPEDCSSCAGIALFHSHAPYAEAYSFAEACCESAKHVMKDRNKQKGIDSDEMENRYMDFHCCQGGFGVDLEHVRSAETEGDISRPWKLNCRSGEVIIECVDSYVSDLNQLDGRTNIKGLAIPALSSQSEFDMEMERIYAHQNEEMRKSIENTFGKPFSDEERKLRRQYIYDITQVYDFWFRKEMQ